MSPYRVQYNESESDIKNYNFLYKNTKHAKTLSIFWNFSKKKNGWISKIEKCQNIFLDHVTIVIEFNTTNPNPILKITISFAQTPKMPKYCRKFGFLGKYWKISNKRKSSKLLFLFLFFIMYKFHNSYFYNF